VGKIFAKRRAKGEFLSMVILDARIFPFSIRSVKWKTGRNSRFFVFYPLGFYDQRTSGSF
jgi:hypothetical protein